MSAPTTAESPKARRTHGYEDPGEMVGGSRGERLYWLPLVVAAGADYAAFTQIVSLALPQASSRIVTMAVLGFTVCALTLAHFAGRFARDRKAGFGGHGWGAVCLMVVPWVLLGLAAFFVRTVVPPPGAAHPSSHGSLNPAGQAFVAALMFVFLYVASGVVAGAGAYLTRNPHRKQYRTAARQYEKAVMRLKRSRPPYERAVSVLQIHARNLYRDDENFKAAGDLRDAYAAEFKDYAAILIAQHLQDPSATDGMTLPDRKAKQEQTNHRPPQRDDEVPS